jgi:glyoxylase-like metal-dependent hydrolase (beta-lactamase superfamily II)
MKITSGCFAVLGLAYFPPWFVNAGFIVGNHTTLIIDSGPSYIAAGTIHGYAFNVRPSNKIIVVNTEKHLDHISGNCFFRENGIDVYGYKGVARTNDELRQDIEEWNESILNKTRRDLREAEIFYDRTHIVNPNKVVNDGEFFDLGEVVAEILPTKGHTQTNISVYVKEKKILYCGDCIVDKFIPNLGSGNIDDWKTWIHSLDMISELELEYIVPGHGDVIRGKEITNQINRMKQILSQAIETGMLPA